MNIPQIIKAEFEIEFESMEDAEVILKTIEPELNTAPSNRSSVTLNLDGKTLCLNIEALDTHILRASINSYLRWIILAHEVMKLNI
ncbi:MAG: KEOPS complex subunit Pcc1 [Methanobacterium sp.]